MAYTLAGQALSACRVNSIAKARKPLVWNGYRMPLYVTYTLMTLRLPRTRRLLPSLSLMCTCHQVKTGGSLQRSHLLSMSESDRMQRKHCEEIHLERIIAGSFVSLSRTTKHVSHHENHVPPFRRIGRIMMCWTLRSNKSPDWRDATNASTSDEWFDSLDSLLDDSVRAALDCDQPPMLDHIASLPLKGDQAGAYAGVLTPLPSRAALLPCVYTGCALRAVKERMSEHDSPKSLTENPDNKY